MYRSVLDRKQQTAARTFRDVFGDPFTVARERPGGQAAVNSTGNVSTP
jgi:hypothetical protein